MNDPRGNLLPVPYYEDIPALRGFVLEDSWVLSISSTPGLLEFTMHLVLSSEHPDLKQARPGEQFDYRPGRLTFEGVTELLWAGQGSTPATDASGERDWGHVDSLKRDNDRFELEGDWGLMQLVAVDVRVDLH